jgi:general secretion pathway protein J
MRAGFTLVELLVALALFGLLAAAGVGLLAVGVTTREATDARLAGQGALLRTRALLLGDLGEAVPRRWRDGSGRAQPAFASDIGSGLVFRTVRAGWGNPDGAARASLQRVEWRLEAGRLERRAAPMIDGAQAGEAAVLVEGVRDLTVRVHMGGQWQARWPVPGMAMLPGALPDAVELSFDSPATGPVVQRFRLPPGQRP